MRIHIRGGRLVDPQNGLDGKLDVFIADGKVLSVGTAPEGFHADQLMDATGLVVCPGLIDLSVRLREPGNEYRATLESEMQAALAGGVTSLVCPPDTDPPLDEPGLVAMLKYRANIVGRARVFPVGALTVKLAGERITEMGELVDAGCVAFSQANSPIVDTNVLMRAMQYAATFGYPVWLPPSDPFLARGGVAHDGEVASRLGLAGIPVAAETVRIATLLLLVRETGARLHLGRLSSASGVRMVTEARARGLPITCDVSINHLHLCDMDIGYFNAHAHLEPPLRSSSDRAALREALRDGHIDAVCSDHTPVDDDAKQLPFAESEPGATGLELLLPLTLKWATEMGLSLGQAVERLTVAPGRILGSNNGHLSPGAAADVCIFDPEAHFRVSRDQLRSQGKNTPFMGLEFAGRVRYTLVDGHLAFDSAA